MTITACRAPAQGPRHRRSRQGCRNCKLRKVKCDEARPNCQGCQSYGLVCNFAADVPDMQLSAEAPPQKLPGKGKDLLAARTGRVSSALCPTPRESVVSTIVAHDAPAPFKLDAKRVWLLYQFRYWMASSWGGAMDGSLQLAHQYPFLMHAVLAVAYAYERHLTSPPRVPSRRTLSELSHFSQSIALLGRQLGKSIRPQDRDALWATASLHSILVFLAADGRSPEEAWPLNESDTCALDWLRMIDAKWVLWNLTDPVRPDGLFRCLVDVYTGLRNHAPPKGISGVPESLVHLCGLDEQSSIETNPYFAAVHAISQLAGQAGSSEDLMKALSFISCMPQSFKALITSRDARALLLLALWYSKAGRAVWWIELRARVEQEAVCIYLRRYHGDDSHIQELLPSE